MNAQAINFARFTVDSLSGGCSLRDTLDALASEGSTDGVRKTAVSVRTLVERGWTFPEACLAQNVFRGQVWKRLLGDPGQTGRIQNAFELALSVHEATSALRSGMLAALPYPVTMLALLFGATLWLFVSGIPLFSASGLIGSPEIVIGMKRGVLEALVFLAVSSAGAVVAITRKASRISGKSGFWTRLETLSGAGLCFEDCLSIAARDWSGRTRGAGIGAGCARTGAEDAISVCESFSGLYERTVLAAARETGEYAQAFRSLAQRQRKQAGQDFSALQKVTEPIITAITGITILILVSTVFIPLILQGGALV